jgi:hypothetical protein
MAGAIFSHPAFTPGGNYELLGYTLQTSPAIAGAPNPFAFVNVPGYENYQVNTDIVVPTATYWDLFRVAPTVGGVDQNGNTFTITLPWSRPFTSWQPLYDMRISSLIDNFRRNHIHDPGIPKIESTVAAESVGSNIMPFMTDDQTQRFYLSFLPNEDPIKIIGDQTLVYLGTNRASAAILQPQVDYNLSEDGGYVDFAVNPPATDYMRVEYVQVKYTNDEVRNMLLNAISQLSLYGINGYEVLVSNNLLYMTGPLPSRDLGEILCMIAYRNVLSSDIESQLEVSEAWKDGKVEYTSDPSRSLQAGAVHLNNIDDSLRRRCNNYILATRNYLYRGEFESFFDVSGVLPVYSLIVAGYNTGGALGWWL